MAILQVHQAKALKEMHEGSSDPGLMQELRTGTDFALRATKVTARSLGKAMSTMAQPGRDEGRRFLDAPVSQAGLTAVLGSAEADRGTHEDHVTPRR